jgi:ABC-type sugar transport system permease subunit
MGKSLSENVMSAGPSLDGVNDIEAKKQLDPPKTLQAGRWYRARVSLGPYLFLSPKLLVFSVFMIMPVGWTLLLSLQTGQYLKGLRFTGLDNFATVFADHWFWLALRNSVIYAVVIIPCSLGLGLLIAGLLNRKIRLRPVFAILLIVPAFTSAVAASVSWAYLLQTDGGYVNVVIGWFGIRPINWVGDPSLVLFVNSAVEIWRNAPFYGLLFLAGMQSIPQYLFDAAAIDGVVGIQAFLKITLPLLRPIMLFAIVMASIWTLQIFDVPFILTHGGPYNASMSLSMYIYRVAFDDDNMGVAAAMSVVQLIAILSLALLELRFLRKEVQF